MAATLETVVKQLEDSGIVAPGKLENFIPPKANPKSVEELVRELVKQNHLTKFQAQQVALGKAKSLIVGEYTILDKIGAGGMGQVFKALHRRMERTVAIKMLPTAMTKDAAALARFQREVVAAAKLSHPNIVAAFDAGQAGSVHFLVMEYVEGTDLSALVKKHGPIDGSKALNYLLQAAKGLEYAHKKGVIHRDIKPANLLLDTEGTVKILDMGLARIEVGGDQATQAELTGTGAVMGTVDYMSPEQAFNTKHADARADIYSLGCTLYYLLAGKCTYDGETIIEKILGHREKPIPSLADVQEGVPDSVQALFEKMVAKKAEDRYQTMSEVIAALEKAIAGQSAPTNLAPPAESTDTGLTKFFQQLPGGTTHKSKPTKAAPPASSFNRKPEASESPVSPAKPNPTLILYGSIAGVLSLLGIPLVLYFALSGGGPKPPKLKPAVATTGAPGVSTSTGSSSITTGYALQFDGKSAYVRLDSWKYRGQTPITVEMWAIAKPLADPTKTPGYLITDIDGGGLMLAPYYAEVGTMKKGQPPMKPTVRALAQFPTQFTHYALVYEPGREIRFYIGGKLQGRTPAPDPFLSSPSPLLLGAQPNGTNVSGFFLGTIDELRISQTARYTDDFTPKPRFEVDADTIALYHFDEGTGDQLLDSSPNKHHGQIVGAKWVKVEPPPPLTNYTLQFDGVDDYVEIPSLKLAKSEPRTVEFWISDYGTTAKQTVFDMLGEENRLYLVVTSGTPESGKAYGTVFGKPSGQNATMISSFELPFPKARQHIAVTFSDENFHPGIFANGQPVTGSKKGFGWALPKKTGTALGGVQGGPQPIELFNGRMHQFRVSRTIRYSRAFTPPDRFEKDADTLALYHFDEGIGDVLKDSSGNGHHGKIVGAKWVPVIAGSSSSADWQPLFNGANLEGWEMHSGKREDWKVENGSIVRVGGNNAEWLRTTRTFRDFTLWLESRSPDSAASGIGLRTELMQIDLQHPRNTGTFITYTSDRAPIYVAPIQKEVWKTNEWNQWEITCRGKTITVLINGQKVQEIDTASDKRFPKSPDEGAIYLEAGSGRVEFRNLEIRELNDVLSANPQSAIGNPQSLTPYEILTSPDYEWTEPENLGAAVNSTIYDANPSLSADGLTLLFDSMRPGGPGNSDLWMCRRTTPTAPWSAAELVGSNVNWNSGERQPALSADGLTLLFSSDRAQKPGEFALWQYTRKSAADPWSGGKKLEVAAQAAGENHGGPEMSSGGLALFFYAHNRPGGLGSSDLWVSRRQAANDPWGAAENLGPGVNSTDGDYSPALSSDGCVLLFSSDRQDGSQGKRDLWMCSRPSPSDPWSTPHNLGQPVNTAATEGDSCLSADGTMLIFNCDRPGGQGGTDLWMSRRALKAKSSAAPSSNPQSSVSP